MSAALHPVRLPAGAAHGPQHRRCSAVWAPRTWSCARAHSAPAAPLHTCRPGRCASGTLHFCVFIGGVLARSACLAPLRVPGLVQERTARLPRRCIHSAKLPRRRHALLLCILRRSPSSIKLSSLAPLSRSCARAFGAPAALLHTRRPGRCNWSMAACLYLHTRGH